MHYVDRQHALTCWALWTGEMSYSWISGFSICGAARSVINKIRQLFMLSLSMSKSRYKHYASRLLLPCAFTHLCVNRDKRPFINSFSYCLATVSILNIYSRFSSVRFRIASNSYIIFSFVLHMQIYHVSWRFQVLVFSPTY